MPFTTAADDILNFFFRENKVSFHANRPFNIFSLMAKAKIKCICVSSFILKDVMYGRSALTFYIFLSFFQYFDYFAQISELIKWSKNSWIWYLINHNALAV